MWHPVGGYWVFPGEGPYAIHCEAGFMLLVLMSQHQLSVSIQWSLQTVFVAIITLSHHHIPNSTTTRNPCASRVNYTLLLQSIHVKWISLYFTCQDDYKLLLSNCHCPSKETAIVNIGWSGRRNLPFYVLLYFWHANAVGRAWIQVKVVFMFRVIFQYQTNVIVCVQYRPNMASGKCWIVETKCGTRSMKVEKGSPSVSSVHILTYDCAL